MRPASAAFMLALAVPLMAHAARWVNVAEGSLGHSLYLDSDSLQRDGAQVQVWTREVFTAEQRSPHIGVLYYSASTLTRFECGKGTLAPLTRVFYGGDGTELRRINLDQVELPALATPGSVQERLLEEACRPPVAKKALPTHLAAADSKPKSEVPPSAAAEAAKPAADKDAPKAGKAAPQKTDAATPAKPAGETKVPAAVPVKAAAHELPRPSVVARYVDHGPTAVYSYALRVKQKRPVKLAAADLDKHTAKDDTPTEHEVHWSYEGSNGPEHWAKLKPEFAACGLGKRQSPIDIQDGARLDLEPIKIDYRPAPLRIIDNGHTVQINYTEGSSISVSGVRYDLKQLHFHTPSEERVNGKTFDMVAHLVHQSADGRLAVIAVLMESGMQNDFLATVWPYLPLESGRETALVDVTIDVMRLLPESRAYFTYMGSLTTPPCSEGVLWLVMKTPVAISPGQAAVFAKLYRMNARPVQPGNGRLIKETL